MTRKLRIAVADDEPDVRDYFGVLLPRLGHSLVATATNGRELVELCSAHKPDLIIADVRMPVMDGDAAIAEICEERPTPFILMTAYSKPVSMNCDGVARAFLTKPVRRESLVNAIESVCAADKSPNE
jgi:CheY-like chemotaxis protein